MVDVTTRWCHTPEKETAFDPVPRLYHPGEESVDAVLKWFMQAEKV
jgi:hypothetical protein